MTRALKLGGSVLVGLVVLTLGTLRVTGLEPPYVDPRSPEFAASGRTTRPGLWLSGEVVTAPVTNWDWVNKLNDPVRRNTIMIETSTWYGIPHSVTTGVVGRGDKLYVHGHSDEERMKIPFPNDKAWTRNVARDPRVRMKIGGKIYLVTLVLMTDRAEVAEVMGRDPETHVKGPDGQDHVKEVMHYWRAFQRDVPEHGSGAHMSGAERPIGAPTRPAGTEAPTGEVEQR